MKKSISLLGSEIVTEVSNIKGCQFVSVSYTTDTDHLNKKLTGGKKNQFYGRLSSISYLVNGQYNASYENGVNNRLPDGTDGKGEKFVAEPLPWGEWLIPNKLITHKGETYLRLYKTKATTTKVVYYLDGVRVSDPAMIDLIKSSFRPESESKRQAAAGIAKADQMKPFTLNVKSIFKANINKVKYTIVTL